MTYSSCTVVSASRQIGYHSNPEIYYITVIRETAPFEQAYTSILFWSDKYRVVHHDVGKNKIERILMASHSISGES